MEKGVWAAGFSTHDRRSLMVRGWPHREPREDETGEGSGSRGAGKAPGQQLTKEQVKAQKAKAKLAKDVAEETAAVNAEL